jgi:hypothetical protein
MSDLHGQAICKDCGSGTLNNAINPCFYEDDETTRCYNCNSGHIDGELYFRTELTPQTARQQRGGTVGS